MNPNDTLDPIPTAADEPGDNCDVWPIAEPARGLRVRAPVAIACLTVVGLAGAAGGAALKNPSSTAVQAGAVGGNRPAGANSAAGINGASSLNGAAARIGGPGGGVVGTVTKVDGDTITVSQRDGTTATVVLTSDTSVTKTVSGSVSDLIAGTSIAVRGTTDDGRTTAQTMTINPANGVGGFGGVGAPPAQPGAADGAPGD